jgi:predicted dehydrogenase
MEIYGRSGTLVASGEDSPQLGEVVLHGAQGGNTLIPIAVPERYRLAAPGTPPGEALNVGQMYTAFARAIGGGDRPPDFAIAVDLHRLVDAIKRSADDGAAVRFA